MAKKDMDLYHSRLNQNDLNNLIIKYKIPRDLHPWLPFKEFVMSELPNDAISIYHWMLDFSGVRIPFSSFLLALIKHYKVHFSQLRPLETSAAIDDTRPAAGSFSMVDVRRLSAHVIKLRDMPEGVLVLSGLSSVWKNRVCDLLLAFMIFYAFLSGLVLRSRRSPILILEDLVVSTHSANFLAKAKASQKRKASSFGATSSHVAKRTSDDDACVAILLVTLICIAVVISFSWNQGGSFTVLVVEGLGTRDSQGKGIMVDNATASSVGAGQPRPSSGSVPSFRDVSGDAIHTDFFPFSVGPYYSTLWRSFKARVCLKLI
nr:hypothetical protein [Tanacetum cinerariifolium]